MTPEQMEMVERIRALIADAGSIREVSMFGARSVMVDERMIISVRKDGGLLVRVDADEHERLLARPGAMQAQMGPGRDMGPGWIEVSADVIRDDEQLVSWVGIAMRYHRKATDGNS